MTVFDHDMDRVDFLAIGLMAVPILTYLTILTRQHRLLEKHTQRVQILSTRTVLFLPTYAILVWTTLVFPGLGAALDVPVAIAEACSFYGFFAMLVANTGGPDATLKFMASSGKSPICRYPKDPLVFYNKVRYALFQCLVFRPVVEVVFAVCVYAGQSQIGLIFSFIALFQLLYAFFSLFAFYEMLAEGNQNLYGGCKFILLKVAVGLIVGQGVVEEVLFATHAVELDGNDEYTASEREQRYLALLILVEYVVLSMIALYAFGARIDLSDHAQKTATEDEQSMVEPLRLSWCDFLIKVFAFGDTTDGLEPGSTLSQGLLQDEVGSNNSLNKL